MFVLFEVIFLSKFCSLVSKSVFVTKCTCAIIVLKFPVVSLLSSEIVVYSL